MQIYKNNFKDMSVFYADIIEYNPAKINVIMAQNADDKALHTLSKIFYDKINF